MRLEGSRRLREMSKPPLIIKEEAATCVPVPWPQDLGAWGQSVHLCQPGLCQLQGEVYHQSPEPVDAHPTVCVARTFPAVMEAMMDLRGTLSLPTVGAMLE